MYTYRLYRKCFDIATGKLGDTCIPPVWSLMEHVSLLPSHRPLMPISNNICTSIVESSNLVHGEVYWIQHYVINFVSDLGQVSGFLHQ